ncbi:MAG: hypothetical protein ACR2NA_05395 [Solirubrobacterales bacterium]
MVRVAGGRNEAEVEFVRGLLLEEGIPSMVQRARGFDVPDFLAAGPRDILVSERAVERSRELLTDELLGEQPPPIAEIPAARLLIWLLIGLVGGGGVLWMLIALTS